MSKLVTIAAAMLAMSSIHCTDALAWQFRIEGGPSFRPQGMDQDFNLRLDRAEVNTLSNDATRVQLAAFITASGGELGLIAATYVNERINEIQQKSGPNGVEIGITIRNGSQLHLFDIFAK